MRQLAISPFSRFDLWGSWGDNKKWHKSATIQYKCYSYIVLLMRNLCDFNADCEELLYSIWRLGQSLNPFSNRIKRDKNLQTNPDIVPYSHNPPGHTCGLPCCNKDLQVHLNKRKPQRSCIGIQDYDILAQNFTFKGKLKKVPGLESGFFSVQEVKEVDRAGIPEFGSIRGKLDQIKEEKNFNFMKGREITLPEVRNMDSADKLYLEDFNLGESDDFPNIEVFVDDEGKTVSVDKLEYYISKNSSGSTKGVPYDPKLIGNTKLYPCSGTPQDQGTDTDTNQKDDSSISNYYSSGSNYYETLQDPEIEEEKSNDEADDIPEKSDSGIDEDRSNSPEMRRKTLPPRLPGLPPKLPVQTQLNHPPLSKPGKLNAQSPDTLSATTYNTYSSVCSISNFANQMSKQAYERFLSIDRDSLSEKPNKRDIRELSYTGDDMPLAAKNLELAATKTKVALTMIQNKSNSLQRCSNHNNDSDQSNVPNTVDNESQIKDAITGTDNDIDEYDDEAGAISRGFKSIKLVDGKMLGSRYSLDRVNSFGDQLHDRFLYLRDSTDGTIDSEDEVKILELLKMRLRDVDKLVESPSGESFNDNPITLIL